jgi:hypothetical protein
MIHLIIGNTGGKTTYSNKLKTEVNGVLFSLTNGTLCFSQIKKPTDGLGWFLNGSKEPKPILDLVMQLENCEQIQFDLGLSKLEHRENSENLLRK